MLPVLVLALFALPQVRVDDDGPADFADIPEAIAAASAGDALFVEPGFYSGFSVDKPLKILGTSESLGAVISGVIGIQEQAGLCTISNLNLFSVSASGVEGRVTILDSYFRFPPSFTGYGLVAMDCEQVLLARSAIVGMTGFLGFAPEPGVRAINSRIEIVDCDLRGGSVDEMFFPFTSPSPAVLASDFSHVRITGSTAEGGEIFGALFPGAPALQLTSGATAEIRGSTDDVIDEVVTAAPPLGTEGGIVLYSGATVLSSSVNVVEVPERAYVEFGGSGGLGSDRTLNAYGPAGQVVLIRFSTMPDLFDAPNLTAGPVWISLAGPSLMISLPLQGVDVPTSRILSMPTQPSWLGASLAIQGIQFTPSGELILTNTTTTVIADAGP